MSSRALAVLLAASLTPVAAGAQALAIDHKPVACLVAGKYGRLNACFAPASRLARARVYFRVSDGPSDWYYVEMKSDAPCFTGVLPRPKRELVGRRVRYYVDSFDRAFVESRTAEAEARVVSAAGECEPGKLVAPIYDSASVAVFPGMPAGFTGAAAGVGGGPLAAVVGGAAALVGGGVAVAGHGPSGGSSPATTLTAVSPDTLPVTATTTTTTTTLPAFVPVFNVWNGAALQGGDTISGPEPLALRFDMCGTAGPYRIRYGVEVDGILLSARCNSTIVFSSAGASPDLTSETVRRSAAPRTFDVRMTIRSEAANNDPKANRRLKITVTPGTAGCAGDKQGPLVRLSLPADGSVYPSPVGYPVHFEATADDSQTGGNGIAFVQYAMTDAAGGQLVLGPVLGAAPFALDWTEAQVNAYLGATCVKFLDVKAYAEDTCGNAGLSAKVTIIVNNTGNPRVCPIPDPTAGWPGAGATASWTSELELPGGAGQVVVNGEAAFPRAGRSTLAARVARGTNRVEGTLVDGRGAGSWRFDLTAIPGLRSDSLRLIAGDVVETGAGVVVFRLRGRAGERVVFSFEAWP